MSTKIELFGTTDVGRVRDHNEDDFVICKDLAKKEWAFKRDELLDLGDRGALLVVADGMGGTNAGEVASKMAQESVQRQFNELATVPQDQKGKEKFLRECISQAHKDVVRHQENNLETAGMGTTLVIGWVIDNNLHVGWSGDSRAYVYNGNPSFPPFTDDHSLVWDLVKEGQMSAEEARTHPESNIITQSLGDHRNPPKPSSRSIPLYEGDKVLLCSDGLNGMCSDPEMGGIVAQEKPVAEICRELIDKANAAGGTDNITVLLLEIKQGKAGARPQNKAVESEPGAPPSNTSILRKKNSNKNILIAILLAVLIAVVAWVVWPEKEVQTKRLKEIELAYEPGESLEVNFADLFSELSGESDSMRIQGQKAKILRAYSAEIFPGGDQHDSMTAIFYPRGMSYRYVAKVMLIPNRHDSEDQTGGNEGNSSSTGSGSMTTQDTVESDAPGNSGNSGAAGGSEGSESSPDDTTQSPVDSSGREASPVDPLTPIEPDSLDTIK